MQVSEGGTTQNQWIRLNNRDLFVGVCPNCYAQCFASNARELKELDGTIHACELKVNED